MKTALEEAQANLSVAANRAKAYADASRHEEKYEVGDEVVLATRHLCINEHLPIKPQASVDWTILYCQGDFSSGLSVESAPTLADSSCLSCIQSEEVLPVGAV